jgi:hypothetical protein
MKLKSFLAACSFLLLAPAQAALLDRGNGMIYDDVLNLTWLQDTRYAFTIGLTGYDYTDDFNRHYNSVDPYGRMIWAQAMSWTAQLNYGGYTDWRLPTSDKVGGYNHSDSELGYMYYVNLGNSAAFTDGVFNPNYGFVNAGPFLNLPVQTAFWTSSRERRAPTSILTCGSCAMATWQPYRNHRRQRCCCWRCLAPARCGCVQHRQTSATPRHCRRPNGAVPIGPRIHLASAAFTAAALLPTLATSCFKAASSMPSAFVQ